ncbi:MAG: FemAB family PEP-CTERM system-associated protein [Gammaproteobacteria bacterium]|nr:FemAB family PEP-CTERM system-associated protein [Gammaproteobacteria bacterium]
MNVQVSVADDKEIARINNYLLSSLHATPYHHMQWLQAIKKAYGFKYEYLIAETESHIEGVLPVCQFKNIMAKTSLCSLPFCDVGGVIADNAAVREKLIQFALERADQQQAMPLQLRQRLTDAAENADMTNRKVSMLLDLPESAEVLLAGFKSKLRSQIKKAEKNGLTFDFANDKKSINDFFYVFCRNMHSLGSPTHSVTWFQALRELYKENLLVGRVWFEGKIVGSGILLFSGNKVSIPWASTLRDYNHLAPNMLLYWNLLQVSCDRACTQFDFGRSTYGEGTYKFKKQWGAKPVLLDWKTLDKQGLVAEVSTSKSRLRDLVEVVWKKLPLLIVNIIGPRLRRHISL